MAGSQVFRHNLQCACATCGAEWFGAGGEVAARSHARETQHQVHIQILQREVLNLVAQAAQPNYAPQVRLSSDELKLSQSAARERVSLFEGPINQRVAR